MRTRSEAAELLSALCLMSPDLGHRHVLDGLTEWRSQNVEIQRFEWLTTALVETDSTTDIRERTLWRWRTGVMMLINALCTGPVEAEERLLLRGELQRRGIGEAFEVGEAICGGEGPGGAC